MKEQQGGEIVIGIIDLLLITSIFSMYKFGKYIKCENEEETTKSDS
jgi:hypothetical protein